MVKLIPYLIVAAVPLFLGSCAPKVNMLPPAAPIITSPVEDLKQAKVTLEQAEKSTQRAQQLVDRALDQGLQPQSKEAKELSTAVRTTSQKLQETTILLAQARTRAEEIDKERQQFYVNWKNAHEQYQKEKENSIAQETLKQKAIRQRNILAIVLAVIVVGVVGLFVTRFYLRGALL